MSTVGVISQATATNAATGNRKKMNSRVLQAKKECSEALTMLIAYDYPTALVLDRAEIDALLVVDSLGMVVLRYENTLPVTMEEMLHSAQAVARVSKGRD
jgi:3-methyl-2-oxobutanoate hydroxymethyltransferase